MLSKNLHKFRCERGHSQYWGQIMTKSANETRKRWTAILLAGQRPGVDALAQHFGETYKALIPVCGKPMIARVVATLLATSEIDRIIVLGQAPDALAPVLPDDDRIILSQSGKGISASIRAVVGSAVAPWPVFVTTADHPLLTPDIVASFLEASAGCDLAIGMVERQTMLAVFPDSKRTWLRFRGGAWSGANLFALNTPATYAALDLWTEAERDRKKAWKLFLHFGPWLAFRAVTRTITLQRALQIAGKHLGLTARLVPMSQVEAAIDVDKVSDHAQAEAILKGAAKIISG
jgi:GTP:adenosylcobinamide-phosphate guanylyltransferase